MLIVYGVTVLLVASLYGYAQFYLFRTWKSLAVCEVEDAELGPFVSVLIACRNEENLIGPCLDSVLDQDYPVAFEIIVLDNHSSDGTLRVLEAYRDNPRIRVIDLSTIRDQEETFKKEALEYGISIAQGDFILTTDADCEVPGNWIRSHIAQLSHGFLYTTGPVFYSEPTTILEKYQQLELAGLMVATGAGIISGVLVLSNGANQAFRKNIFSELGKYEGNDNFSSGDDVMLAQKIYKALPEKITFIKNSRIRVNTAAEESFLKLLRQRIRWASKTRGYLHKPTKWIGILVFINSFVLLVNLLLTVAFGSPFFLLFLIHFGIKISSDQLLLSEGESFFDFRTDWATKIFSHLFNPVVQVIVGILSMTMKDYYWKGRRTS